MSSSQAKPVQWSPAMVSFIPDNLNILQEIKSLFSIITLVFGVLDGMVSEYGTYILNDMSYTIYKVHFKVWKSS